MDSQLIEENKQKLLAEQKRLKSLLGYEGKPDATHEFPGGVKPEFTELGNEDGENASEVENFSNDLGVASDLEEKLRKVEAALKRIEDGTYGKDANGNDIDEARLRAVPEADSNI